VNERAAHPPFDDAPVGLPESPLAVALDAERLQHGGWHPRQLGTRVHEHRPQGAALAGARRVLDRDIHAERSHVVAHHSSSVGAE
jgi:hypothetical protein